MKSVTVGKFKAKLSAYLKAVRNGEEILVRSRDIPVAKVIPADRSGDGVERYLNPISLLRFPARPGKPGRKIDPDKILRELRRDKW